MGGSISGLAVHSACHASILIVCLVLEASLVLQEALTAGVADCFRLIDREIDGASQLLDASSS